MPALSPSEETSSFAYAPGDVIASKYLLEHLIGEGGMGAVYRARNTSLDMLVAIKLMRADLNRELLAGRMMQEARAVAKLSHPGIVRVFDVGQTALGDPFIVMELLEGETLSALLDRERRLMPVHAVQLFLPIADALSAAHAKGLVHRDVKPDNVLLVNVDEGIVQPKLLDFGIVKSAQPDGTSGASDAGSVVGSPDYMSPEQARGLPHVDSRSDLWSFSVVLYEALAGTLPFHANDYDTLLRKIVLDEPKTLLELGVANQALSYIVSRGLSKDPTQRYSSIGQMGRALAAWLADQGMNEDACGVSLDTKWLARQTDPMGLGRASWPPPPRTDVSGVHDINLIVSGTPAAPVSVTVPPSSLAPVVEETESAKPAEPQVERGGRRSLFVAAVAFVVTLLVCIGIAKLTSRPQQVPVAFVASSAAPATEVELPKPSVAIASTVEPLPIVSPEAIKPAETAAPPAVDEAPAREARPANHRRREPAKAPPTPPPVRQARPSDILAPMPF